MKCWSCRKEIPDTTKFCPHCEAEVVEELTANEKEAAEEFLASMSPDLIDELRNAFENSATGEEFVNRIMVGDCPKCGSSNTADCEQDPEIDDACIARCLDCGQLWCPDCGELFQKGHASDHDCPAWEDLDFDDEDWGDEE